MGERQKSGTMIAPDTNIPNDSTAHAVGCDECSASSDVRAKLDALSPRAKEWLEKTCERFAENEGYDKWPEEIAECVAAGLIRKRSFYVEIHEDVMGLVYSESYFQQNTNALAAPTENDHGN